MKDKTLLVVNTGYSKKKFVFKKLKALGINVICLNNEKNWADEYVSDWIVADNSNHDQCLSRIVDYLKKTKTKIDGVITFWEDDVLLTSKISDKLGTIGIPHKIASNVRNKFKFREFCKENNLPTPKHVYVSQKKDLGKVKEKLKFPVVIKPAFGTLTAMIVKVETPEQLESEYEFIKRNLSTEVESALADGLDIFIEEYIDGDEVDIDIILQNGKMKLGIVSDNFEKSRGRFFLDVGQVTPSNLPESQQTELLEMAEVVLEKLGIANGCIHFEAKYSSEGPVPLEANLRMGGDYVYSYIKSAWDIDFIELSAKVVLGEYIDQYKDIKNVKHVIGWDFFIENSGVVSEFSLPQDLEKQSFFEESMFYKELGDTILVPPEGFETLGWITISGSSFPDADDNLKSILKKSKIRVTKFDYESNVGKFSNRESSLTKILAARNYLKKQEKVNYLSSTKIKKLDIAIVSNIDKNDSYYYPRLKSFLQEIKSDFRISVLNQPNPLGLIERLKKKDIDIVLPILNPKSFPYLDILKSLELANIPLIGSSFFVNELVREQIKLFKVLEFHKAPLLEWDYMYEIEDEVRDEFEFPINLRSALANKRDKEILAKNYKEFDKIKLHMFNKKQDPIIATEVINSLGHINVSLVGNSISDLNVWSESISNSIKIPKKLKDLITETALDVFYIIDSEDFCTIRFILDAELNPYLDSISFNILDIELDKSKLLLEKIIKSSIYRLSKKDYENRL